MGTRALVHVNDGGTTLLTIYRQFDGYPTGMGKDLAAILRGRTIVNGFGAGMDESNTSNGMGCLAATLVKQLKDGIGNVYVYPPCSSGVGEEYVYTVNRRDGRLTLSIVSVYGGTDPLYAGFADDLTDDMLDAL